ncbi:hypothetical protein [Comamonas thiooxydans]|uniref:hypothetical protein n=1 Tax=Comamonas thiooxydans TaxID=363952 RepID=UPI00103B51E4|nr:hypothetical protein [Comamonas thiooxydans]
MISSLLKRNHLGAAAAQRGDASIRRGLHAHIEKDLELKDLARALAVAEESNAFVRDALAYLVEPRGLRQAAVEGAKARRGWASRSERLTSAHCCWVDVDSRNVMAYHAASVRRAQAAYALLSFALGSWTIPGHIKVPRAALA